MPGMEHLDWLGGIKSIPAVSGVLFVEITCKIL